MGFCKFLPFLALGLLVLYHAGLLQAAPIGFAADNCTSPIIEEESEFVLVAVMQSFDQIDAAEQDLEKEIDDTNVIADKNGCSTTDCLTRELLDLLGLSDDVVKKDSLPTNADNNTTGQPPETIKA